LNHKTNQQKTMDTIVSALLYLSVITSGNDYTAAQINNYATMFAGPISTTINNPTLLEAVLVEYDLEAIVIIDDMGG